MNARMRMVRMNLNADFMIFKTMITAKKASAMMIKSKVGPPLRMV